MKGTTIVLELHTHNEILVLFRGSIHFKISEIKRLANVVFLVGSLVLEMHVPDVT